MRFERALNLYLPAFIFIFALSTAALAAEKTAPNRPDDQVTNAFKMLEKIETQANSKSIDAVTKKQFIEMLELEIERENFFIEELKERLKYFDQYLDMLEVVKSKTEELKAKLEGGAQKSPSAGRISAGSQKQITADQILDLETYANFSESKKMLEDIEKEVDQNKIDAAGKLSLVKNLTQQLVSVEKLIEETRNNKRSVEKNIIKMLEVKLRSKNLLDKFYKILK